MKRIIQLASPLYLIAGLLLVGILCVLIWQLRQNEPYQSSTSQNVSLINESVLMRLARTDIPIDRTHLANSVTPPTNKWFSGFALQSEPKPGYNYPNSFKPRSDGFEFSLPKVRATDTLIVGSHTADMIVLIDDASTYKLTTYDELMVELTYYTADNEALAVVRVASGLPYVYISATEDIAVSFNGKTTNEGVWTSIRSNDRYYGANASASNNRFMLAKGNHASFFSAPSENALEAVAQHAGSAIESGEVSYQRRGDSFATTITYTTINDEPILFARLPHQQRSAASDITFESILGDMTTEIGKEFSFETPVVPVFDALDLSDISDQDRNILISQLRNDVTAFEEKSDTYFGGKQLYRMAQLLIIADQLEENEAATAARAFLKRELETWFTLGRNEPKSFLYEPSMQGIVGNEASFGSDREFNDHHFHYGYFIYAAAILSQYDSEFLDTHRNMVNLLVADIANYNTNEGLPRRRSFDPYAGHSWASGTAPFADGNNQESTSEAINAWVGVSLWARQIDNDALELQADWMLSQEYHTAQHYWLLQNDTMPEYLKDYTSPIASIVWGGKREYATFFSDAANAKLAIQLLPISPTISQLNEQLPEGIFTGTSVNQIYGDSILMAQPGATLQDAIDLPDSSIDDGNSRTYLYAYIMSKRK